MTWLETIRESIAPTYLEFVDRLQDDLFVGKIAILYSWSSVVERNETHDIDVYLPGYLAIGNDSGDCEFLIRRDGSASVFRCDAGAIGSVEPEWLHSEFTEWVEAGCQLPHEPERSFPLEGSLWLTCSPANGLKGMFELRKILGQSWPASEMKIMMAELPSLLVRNGHPFKTFRMLENRPEYLACLGFGESAQSIALAVETSR